MKRVGIVLFGFGFERLRTGIGYNTSEKQALATDFQNELNPRLKFCPEKADEIYEHETAHSFADNGPGLFELRILWIFGFSFIGPGYVAIGKRTKAEDTSISQAPVNPSDHDIKTIKRNSQ